MNIRGSALGHTRVFLVTRWGEDTFTSLTQRLSPPSREVITSTSLSPHGWYPVSAWNEVVDQMARRLGKPGADVIGELASYIASEDLTTAHKVLLKLGTPGLVMRQAGTFWSRYFNGGGLVPSPEGDRRFRVVLHLGTNLHLDPGQLTCRHAVPAWQESAIRLAGGVGARSAHVKCRFDGHPRCEFDVTWAAR